LSIGTAGTEPETLKFSKQDDFSEFEHVSAELISNTTPLVAFMDAFTSRAIARVRTKEPFDAYESYSVVFLRKAFSLVGGPRQWFGLLMALQTIEDVRRKAALLATFALAPNFKPQLLRPIFHVTGRDGRCQFSVALFLSKFDEFFESLSEITPNKVELFWSQILLPEADNAVILSVRYFYTFFLEILSSLERDPPLLPSAKQLTVQVGQVRRRLAHILNSAGNGQRYIVKSHSTEQAELSPISEGSVIPDTAIEISRKQFERRITELLQRAREGELFVIRSRKRTAKPVLLSPLVSRDTRSPEARRRGKNREQMRARRARERARRDALRSEREATLREVEGMSLEEVRAMRDFWEKSSGRSKGEG